MNDTDDLRDFISESTHHWGMTGSPTTAPPEDPELLDDDEIIAAAESAMSPAEKLAYAGSDAKAAVRAYSAALDRVVGGAPAAVEQPAPAQQPATDVTTRWGSLSDPSGEWLDWSLSVSPRAFQAAQERWRESGAIRPGDDVEQPSMATLPDHLRVRLAQFRLDRKRAELEASGRHL